MVLSQLIAMVSKTHEERLETHRHTDTQTHRHTDTEQERERERERDFSNVRHAAEANGAAAVVGRSHKEVLVVLRVLVRLRKVPHGALRVCVCARV